MITVITRIYETSDTANDVLGRLKEAGFPEEYFDLIGKGKDAKAQMAEADVNAEAAEKYAPLLNKGNSLVVVRAPFTPFGAAMRAKEIVDSVESIDAGVEEPDASVEKIYYTGPSSVMKDHPHFLLPQNWKPRSEPITGALGFKMLSARKEKLSVSRTGRRYGAFMPLLSKKQRKISVRHDAQTITGKMMPLLTGHRRELSASASIGTIFSDFMGFPSLIRR